MATCIDWEPVHGDDVLFDPSCILALGLPTVLWGGNHFSDKLPASGGWLVWDKERPDELDQSTCELAWTNCIKGVRRFRHLWNGLCRDSEIGEHLHPMQKPVALYEWILSLRWMKHHATILDTYMGSGPCGVACVRAGRRYVGIEKHEPYCEIAANRLRAERERFPLFEPKELRQRELLK